MRQPFEHAPKAKIEKLASSKEFLALIRKHLNTDSDPETYALPTYEPTATLRALISLMQIPFDETLLTPPEKKLFTDLNNAARIALRDDQFSFGSEKNITLLAQVILHIKQNIQKENKDEPEELAGIVKAAAQAALAPLEPPPVKAPARASTTESSVASDIPPLVTSTTPPATLTAAPAASPAKKSVWERFRDSFTSPKKPAAAKPATPAASSTTASKVGMADDLAPLETSTTPPPAQPALLVTPISAVNFTELLAAKNAVKEINEKLPKGYTLKDNGSGSYHLDGPIKILIRPNGQMVAYDENRKHKDYAEHVLNAMHAICTMNFHLGYTFTKFNWSEQIPEAKKAEFDAKKADLEITFSEKLDAGNVLISSGPTAGTQKSNYDINYFLNKTGVADAIQKAVGTKDCVFNNGKNTITRTFSDGQKRTLTIQKDGSITGPAIPLEERFKTPLPADKRVESQIEARLYNDFVVMARFYVTLYQKEGLAALPETLDFRSRIQGTTWQKKHLAKITDQVFKKLIEQEFQNKPFMGKKGYYPQEFLDRVLFNGAKVNLQAVDSQKRAAPDSPDEEPAAKRQNLSMRKE